ncbi:16S rRNA methyltransferase G [Anoxybacter fermentans]|uniref:Ribosomal RNA small subunit methyltransferase G n=1 Tax=Anoxybacter fermentans TaxID=1323375 RepID=A0A3S9T186_9FIRM|nr:16S rRNA (guanine(527)-N(7))-methyltransferase RsmG [Anoxybacter fermentans]AZR74299.1 16S rRNA methyltransferase G [Anoxybacter fermentans]
MISTRDILTSGLEELGLIIKPEQIDLFEKFMDLMLDWNEKINLTAITEPYEVITKHFIDSVTPLAYAEKYELDLSSVLDLGTGGGFPGVPLKIIRPKISVLLADSLKKRIKYLELVIKELGLKDISVYHGRAEEMGQDPKFREKFTNVFSRAVAEMNILVEYCLPLVKVGGMFVALKGPDLEDELNQAKRAIKLLGGEIVGVECFDLPLINDSRTLVFIKKVNPTPGKYPRRPGKPKKNPL